MYSSFSASSFLFQSTYLYKVRQISNFVLRLIEGFNPRTYIRYDQKRAIAAQKEEFQSTYLYKVRPIRMYSAIPSSVFQSTYLYKVRLHYK